MMRITYARDMRQLGMVAVIRPSTRELSMRKPGRAPIEVEGDVLDT